MKNILGIFIAAMGIMVLWSCNPIENRQVMTGAATEADVRAHVKIESIPFESEITPGKMVNSNYIRITSDGLAPCVTSFTYGLGTFVGTNIDSLQAFVVTGDQTVLVNVLNADGTRLDPIPYPITVDETFNVAPEWAIFCGDGEKVWSWDATQSMVWGNGGYLGNNAPAWWGLASTDPSLDTQGNGNEGGGATMTFSASGATLTLKRTNGTSTQGTFSFDMSKRKGVDFDPTKGNWQTGEAGEADAWSIGQLYTSAVTVLIGVNVNADKAPFYTYDILKLNENEIVLGAPDDPNEGAWSEAWFWMFRAQ